MTAPSLRERPSGLLAAVRPSAVAPAADTPPGGGHRAAGRRQDGGGRRAGGRAGGRRPALLLVAALVGGIAAAAVSLQSAPSAAAGPASVITAEQALGSAEQGTEVQPMAQITLTEARARLEQVRVSREARAKRDAAAQEAARPTAVLPIHGAYISSCFCARWGTFHWGVDFAAPMDTPEYAAMDGVVIRAGAASGFGLAVYILHDNGDVTVYGHMDKILVSAGQVVQAGQTIALLGARGQATGPHLHFEVHQGGMDGKRIDPLPWLRARGVAV
jgi:murein DD-endopeptidase MepM/ murein hydrolase activator NlpD